jgi:hypothetical protein
LLALITSPHARTRFRESALIIGAKRIGLGLKSNKQSSAICANTLYRAAAFVFDANELLKLFEKSRTMCANDRCTTAMFGRAACLFLRE